MDWARCANGRRKESKSRSRERAQMDEDTVPLEPDDDADFFDQQSTKKISKEARQDRSGLGKGTTIPIAKTVIKACLVVCSRDNTFAYLCRERIGRPWIGWGVPMRDTRRASPEIGRGLRWTRIQCLSSPKMRIFMISSPPRRSARWFVRTVRRPSPGDTSPLPWEKGVELPPPSISVGQPDFYAEDEAGVWSSTTSRVELSPHSRNSSWVELSPHSRPSSNYARVELSPYFRSSTRVELSPCSKTC